MRWHHRLYVALRGLFNPSSIDRDLDEELQFHFDKQVETNLAAGMTREQARRAAAIAIGNPETIREACRDGQAGAWPRQFARDLSHGLRLMKKAPGFSIAAIAIITVGIAAVTAIFSVVYGVVLRPLPFPEPDRLVQIWARSPRYARDGVSAADRRDWQTETKAFEGIGLYNPYANFNLTDGAGDPERLLAARISANALSVLRVTPMLGRGFIDGEDQIGRERVVILGYDLWRRRFGSDPSIVGRSIRLSGVPHEVVGVAVAGFPFPERPYDVLVPLTVNPKELTREVPPFGLRSFARLKPGVTIAEAQSQMDVVARRLSERYAMNKDVGVEVVAMQSSLVGDVRRGLLLLAAAVAALLFVAAFNLAGLLSARAATRSREMMVRLALGASRQRVLMQSVAEIVPMLAIGGLAGVIAAAFVVRYFIAMAPATMPRVDSIVVDRTVLFVATAVLMITGLVAAVLPGLQAWTTDLVSPNSGRGATGSPKQTRMRNVLVVAQVTLSLPLVIGAMLLARSFANVLSIDPGFRSEAVVSMHLAIPRSKYRNDSLVAQFEGQLLERVRHVPGVRSAAFVNRLPLSGIAQNVFVEFEDRPGESMLYGRRVIASDYFSTLGIPLVEGRGFNEGDSENAPIVAIIDQRIAKQQWPNVSPIGKRLRFPARAADAPASPWMQIVGVVGHVKHDGLDQESAGQIYWDYRQTPQDRAVIVARVTAHPGATMASMIAGIHEIDPEQPVYDARTLDDVLERSVSQRWLSLAIVGSFASIALFLCCVGLYGVIAFGVTQSRREFGIRVALGASRRDIAASVVSRGIVIATMGIASGLVIAALLTRTVTSLLFGVAANDLVSFAGATVSLLAVAFLASYLPARRAAAVEPAITLRAE